MVEMKRVKKEMDGEETGGSRESKEKRDSNSE